MKVIDLILALNEHDPEAELVIKGEFGTPLLVTITPEDVGTSDKPLVALNAVRRAL